MFKNLHTALSSIKNSRVPLIPIIFLEKLASLVKISFNQKIIITVLTKNTKYLLASEVYH